MRLCWDTAALQLCYIALPPLTSVPSLDDSIACWYATDKAANALSLAFMLTSQFTSHVAVDVVLCSCVAGILCMLTSALRPARILFVIDPHARPVSFATTRNDQLALLYSVPIAAASLLPCEYVGSRAVSHNLCRPAVTLSAAVLLCAHFHRALFVPELPSNARKHGLCGCLVLATLAGAKTAGWALILSAACVLPLLAKPPSTTALPQATTVAQRLAVYGIETLLMLASAYLLRDFGQEYAWCWWLLFAIAAAFGAVMWHAATHSADGSRSWGDAGATEVIERDDRLLEVGDLLSFTANGVLCALAGSTYHPYAMALAVAGLTTHAFADV